MERLNDCEKVKRQLYGKNEKDDEYRWKSRQLIIHLGEKKDCKKVEKWQKLLKKTTKMTKMMKTNGKAGDHSSISV